MNVAPQLVGWFTEAVQTQAFPQRHRLLAIAQTQSHSESQWPAGRTEAPAVSSQNQSGWHVGDQTSGSNHHIVLLAQLIALILSNQAWTETINCV